MKFTILLLGIFLFFVERLNAQRVAPGVPPQHYQQQQPQYQQQQQYQQVPVQHQQYQQQPQQQYQQQPQQQYQQQPQHQQQYQPQQQQPGFQQQQPGFQQQHTPPPPGGHDPHHPQKVLNAANIQHEKDHIAEHMDVPIDTSKMSDQELQFHYFKMHDSDNNNKLDGCELIKSLIHWHEQGSKEAHPSKPQIEEKIFSDEELVALIDPILQMDDTSRDGYIDYPEFATAQQKARQQQSEQQQKNQPHH